jgi:hypothetical protein
MQIEKNIVDAGIIFKYPTKRHCSSGFLNLENCLFCLLHKTQIADKCRFLVDHD